MAEKKENPIPIPQRFAVTYEEAGYLLGVSAHTMRGYVEAGLIRPLRPTNGLVRLRVQDVEALAEKMVGHVFDTNEMVLKPIEVYGI